MSEHRQSEDDPQTKTPAQQWIRSGNVKAGTAAFKYLTENEAIAPGIIEAATKTDGLREGPNGTAWFAHRGLNDEITGVSGNGPEFNVMLRGSHKSLFRLPGSEDTSRIVVTEQPLEALAIAQIEKLRPDTLYAATGGGMSMASVEALTTEIARIREQPGAELSIATGRSNNAEQAARFIAKIGEEAKIGTVRNAPPGEAFTWHTHLRANPTADSLAPAQSASEEKSPSGVIVTGAQGGPKIEPPQPDPLKDLLEQLKKAAASGDSEEMENLRKRIDELIAAQNNPELSGQASHTMRIAWILMDTEKLTGARVQIEQGLREDLETRAVTNEGVKNSSVARLLAATRNISDQKLVKEIRNLADFTATHPYPQMTTEITRMTAHLEDQALSGLAVARTVSTAVQQKAVVKQVETASESQNNKAAANKEQYKQEESQSAKQTKSEANQAVNQNNSSNIGGRKEQATGPAVPTNQVVAPVRQSGDFLKVLNGIAMAWHEKIYGPGSFASQRQAEKHAEAVEAAKARGEAPPPAPSMPPPPTFSYGATTPQSATQATPAPSSDRTASSDPARADQTDNTPSQASAQATSAQTPEPRRSPVVDYALDTVFGTARPDEIKTARADAPANWPKHADTAIDGISNVVASTNIADRLQAVTIRAEKAGAEAKAAVEDLLTGPGRDIASRITHAAKAEGGNVDTVLAEMKPDGKYASLRTEFEAQIQQNPALAEATERAVAKVTAYGEAREALDNALRRVERGPEDVEEKFRPTDEALAKATSLFPGSAPGTAMIENLGQKIREALRHVIDVIRNAIGLETTPTQQPRQDNRPGMGM